MVRPSDELVAAWRGLSDPSVAEGWRTIPIARAGACQVLAAREFPGNLEAALFAFGDIVPPGPDQLPDGHGFSVRRTDPGIWGAAGTWLALSRKDGGRLDLFLAMVEDVLRALGADPQASSSRALRVFLDRIHAWQAFMRNGGGVLSPESELGLVGELFLLRGLLELGLSPQLAVDAWQGPLDGLHDFVLGPGAIEVKTTSARDGFTATVFSLEQLDDALHSPLLFAGIRLLINDEGLHLPELVRDLESRLAPEPAAASVFRERYLAAGYSDALQDRYTRRFTELDRVLCLVEGAFPRLIRSMVPIGVVKARYEINLAHLPLPTISLSTFLMQLGVTFK